MLLEAWRTRLYSSLKAPNLNISIWTQLLQFPKDFPLIQTQQEFLKVLHSGDQAAISKFRKIKSNREQLIYELVACLAIDVLKNYAPLSLLSLVKYRDGHLLDTLVDYAKACDYFEDHKIKSLVDGVLTSTLASCSNARIQEKYKKRFMTHYQMRVWVDNLQKARTTRFGKENS